MSRPKDTPFHNPFAEVRSALEERLREARLAQERAEEEKRAKEEEREKDKERERERERELAREGVRGALASASSTGQGDPDEEAFRQAMAGIRPLDKTLRVGPQRAQAVPLSVRGEDAEATALLADLVAGAGPFDISDTVEYVEGIAQGVDRRLLRRLRRGDFALQGHLDLHGLSRPEARAAVEGFLAASHAAGKRCVLVIHGRGLSSKDREPVLKPALVSWLSHGRLGRRVLAFATARPADGGPGAMQVLLRR